MGGMTAYNDNDDVQLKGATDATLIGNIGDRLKVTSSHSDTIPSNGTITAVDSGTSSLVGANGQVFYFGTPTTNSAATFTLSSIQAAAIQANILGGGGTLVVEVSLDGGSFWFRPNVYQIGTQSYANSFTSPFAGVVNVAGMTHVRVRAITSWAGTATIIVVESLNLRPLTIADAIPAGANVIGAVTANAGTNLNTSALALDTSVQGLQVSQGSSTSGEKGPLIQAAVTTAAPSYTTAQTSPLSLTTVGNLRVDGSSVTQPVSGTVTANQGGAPWADNITQVGGSSLTLGQKVMASSIPVTLASDQSTLPIAPVQTTRTTYSAAVSGLVSALLATDIFTISGSGTKTIRVTKISIDGLAAAGSNLTVNLIKRSTANTGGTSTTPTSVPHDSTSAAGTATIHAYTVNPTVLGTAVGTLRSNRVFISGVSTTASAEDESEWGDLGQAIVLRGTAESLCMNLAATTLTTPSLNIWCEWTEE